MKAVCRTVVTTSILVVALSTVTGRLAYNPGYDQQVYGYDTNAPVRRAAQAHPPSPPSPAYYTYPYYTRNSAIFTAPPGYHWATNQPTYRPTIRPTSWPVRPTPRPLNKPPARPMTRPIARPINMPINRPTTRPAFRQTPRPIARTTTRRMLPNPPASQNNVALPFPLNNSSYHLAGTKRCNGGAPCIQLSDCTGLYTQLQHGTTPQLTALLRSLHCGFQYDIPMICCPPEFQGQSNNNAINDRAGYDPLSLLPSNRVCGIQNNDRIVGGTQTDLDEHPWMALLRYDKPRGWGFYCGGVLISSRYVLTAAHCVKGDDLPTNWRLSQVRLGEWNTSSSRDCLADDCTGPVQDIPVEQIMAHEDYDPKDSNQHNDIALLRLAQNARFTDFVKPICLPLSSDLKRSSFEGLTMEVAGWGKTETRSESDVKLKVRVPVVSRTECAKVFNRVGREIINKQMCAGGNAGEDSCRGDSGGSLMGEQLGNSNNWFAVGVVSYGPSPCGTPGWPGVYTRVGAYVDWILSKLRP